MPPLNTDPANWFLADRENPDTTLSIYTSGNSVEVLTDGNAYFGKLHELISVAVQGDYVFLAGWRMDGDQRLIDTLGDDTRVDRVLAAARGRDVDVRVLLSNHALAGNGDMYQFFESLSPPILSVREARFPRFGSAHQKFATVSVMGGLHAFCGGIDLAKKRASDPGHGSGGWHDLQCYVRGPACLDIDRTFRERWSDGRRPSSLQRSTPSQDVLPDPPAPSGGGTHHVQVLRTYACSYGYPFAARGEVSSKLACLKAISLARHYIYIEDQYFVSLEIILALREALRRELALFVLVVVPKEPLHPKGPFIFFQNRHADILRQEFPDRFAIFHLLNPNSGEATYVHSKTIIVDDIWVKSGSTNISRRDLTHDHQLDIAVIDDERVDGVCRFARDLRVRLWAEHLRVDADPALVDPWTGFDRWREIAGSPNPPVVVHTIEDLFWKDAWKDLAVEPDGSCSAETGTQPGESTGEDETGSGEDAADLLKEADATPLADVLKSLGDLPGVPVNWVTLPQASLLLNNVGVAGFETSEDTDHTTIRIELLFAKELSFGLPGLEGFALVLGSDERGEAVQIEVELRPEFFAFRIIGNMALRVDRGLLAPVARTPEGWEELTDRHSEIRFTGTVQVDGDGDASIETSDTFNLVSSMIAGSGVVIEAERVVPVLSSKTALPAGHPPEIVPGWRGVFVERAAVHLPATINIPIDTLICEHCYIGTGGFTGSVSNEWLVDPPTGDVFGLAFSLSKVELAFRQNVIVASEIQGTLTVPFFDQPIAVDLGLGVNGDFTAALSAVQPAGVTRTDAGLIEFEKPDILRLTIDTLGFEKHGGDVWITLSGAIKLLHGGLDWPEVEVRELSIDQHGHIHIDGGWLDLPSSKTLDFYGFTMELTQIGFGNDADRKWVGFSGAIRLADELAFGASVEGLKLLWNASGPANLQMSSIRVELEIPDVLSFDGFVEYFAAGTTKSFRGDIALVLHSLDVSLDARLVVGRNNESPPYHFFYILVDAGLPAGIPLGQSNLALYGFSALMANNMAPTRTADQPWFQWYLLPPVGTTDTDKWAAVRGGQALGAGVLLGTAADDGFAFSAKALLILLLPGPLLLIDGKANMLKPRKELAGNAQGDHRALAVLDRRAGTFLLNLQPRFKYDEFQGAMLDVIGAAEVFFDFNRPNAWHVYLGEDEPLEQRIRAKVFKGLLKADSFLMLDHSGMRVGARAGFDEDYKYGPLRVALKALVEGEADVSWRPTQAEGALTLEGLASLRAFGCKSSASVQARLDVDTPKPFHVEGSFRVKLKTPWPLRDPSARVRLEWGHPDEETEQEETVARVAAEHLKVPDTWDLERTPRQSPQSVSAGVPTIPLDSKVLINFNRPVADRALVGCNAAPSPPRERVGRVEVLHELVGVKLSRAQHSGWVSVEERVDGAGDGYGMWLPLPGGQRAAGKLQLWSGSPFAYTRNTGRSYADWFLAEHPSYPRVPQAPADQVCVNFDAVKLRAFPALFVVGDLVFEYLFTAAEMQPKLETYQSPWTGTKHALLVTDATTVDDRIPVRITVPEPASEVRVFANADRPTRLSAFRDGQEVASGEAAAAGNAELVVRAAGIDYVELSPTGPDARGHVRVLQVCFTTQADRNRVDDAQRADDHLTKEMAPETARWCGEGHLLEPGSLYELEISTQIRTWRDGEEDAGEPLREYVYFRTAGPPGFFADEGRLRDLMPYVSRHLSSPPSGARDVYRDYDVRLAFNENYLERMYDGTSHTLGVALFDRNGPADDEAGQLVSTSAVWSRGPEVVTSDADRLWRWAVSRALSEGSGDIAGCGAPPSILEARLDGRPLSPRALVEARTIVAGRSEPIYRTSFVTSAFVTFVHHLHSFRDVAWDHPLATPVDVARVGAIVTTVRDAGPDFHAETEGPWFEELWSLFGLGQRPLPDRVEIAMLRDADRSYALLLQSPQPIQWSRTSLTVRSCPDAAPRTAATGPVKIIGASLRRSDLSATDFNAESLDLLIESDADLSRFSIEYTGGGAGTTMTTYWTFGDEPVLPAGTVLRIHAGAQAPEEAVTPECLHRYATPAGEEGRWRLNETGDTVRLLDAAGVERQRWTVMPSGQFQAMTPILVRSADETRAFMIFPESAAMPVGRLPEGRIRMAWQFARDIGPFAPVLTRRGRSDPEVATLEFSLPAPATA